MRIYYENQGVMLGWGGCLSGPNIHNLSAMIGRHAVDLRPACAAERDCAKTHRFKSQFISGAVKPLVLALIARISYMLSCTID